MPVFFNYEFGRQLASYAHNSHFSFPSILFASEPATLQRYKTSLGQNELLSVTGHTLGTLPIQLNRHWLKDIVQPIHYSYQHTEYQFLFHKYNLHHSKTYNYQQSFLVTLLALYVLNHLLSNFAINAFNIMLSNIPFRSDFLE
jgi:hypothetical protein